MSTVRWVLINRASELTGYTVNAIQHKIKGGVWPQGKLWRKAPDGRILINLEEFDRWAESAPQEAA
ncbi:excisionase [Halopseudomonas phragmitis]|uniref:Excisionase n=1 Tax=Halopseudomonas phragmitis TaxID=1931241 RepID=A0A1V0B9L5_9GAMM|nr:excisionase [Halopseudomonas phragmitis]AQZ96581.1 excisionase [Halopseudomonas phragmitis]